MRKILIMCALIITSLAGLLWYVLYQARHLDPSTPMVAECTMEALLCPDGSAVGRSGPTCTFAPCPNAPSFIGELIKQNDTLVLSMPSLEGRAGVTVIIPLEGVSIEKEHTLVGKQVVVTGAFRAGNTFTVATIEEVVREDNPFETSDALTSFRVGETKRVQGLQMTLENVSADNRCPSDVQCVTAGSVSVLVTLMNDSGSEVYTLRSADSPHVFGEWQVSIADVTPTPVRGETISQTEYRVTFRVEPVHASSLIETYLREHITELSPARAVLGGAFQVTAVRTTSDTTAVVDYEDGHVAFTADVTFTIAPQGGVKVEDFRVRRQ